MKKGINKSILFYIASVLFLVASAIDFTSGNENYSHKYSQFRGNRPFKEAAASFYKKQYGVDLDAEREICVMGGAKIGLVELPLALMNPGDLLLLPDPGYPDYLSGVSLGRVAYETFPLTAENDFLPDLDAIPEETARRAKFIYINYPNNPDRKSVV